jgi:hypothetical protein
MPNVQNSALDFSGFQGRQNAKTVDITITPSELITHCPPYSSPQSRQSRPAVDGRTAAFAKGRTRPLAAVRSCLVCPTAEILLTDFRTSMPIIK